MYDSLIVTNLPAFYKINLWNQVAKGSKIFVIFIGKGSVIRTTDFVNEAPSFEHVFLSEKEFEEPSLARLFKLIKLLFVIPRKRLLICGWDVLEYWLCAFASRKSINTILVESSEHEGAKSGIKFWLKKLFLFRMSSALVSGVSQERLLHNLGFMGCCVYTGGVGIFHKFSRKMTDRMFNGKFLYVGRLSSEKNIRFLLNLFAGLPNYSLTIAGTGMLDSELRCVATDNVYFAGHLPNTQLHSLYETHNVLLLPSLIEPWGLVVEEAVYFGMPVVVSDKVGCAEEMVLIPKTGMVLPLDASLWYEAFSIFEKSESYKELSKNCYDFDFEERDRRQVEAFY